MRLIVCGARDYDDYHAIKAAIADYRGTHPEAATSKVAAGS